MFQPAAPRPVTPPPAPSPRRNESSSRPIGPREDSINGFESDPWASPTTPRIPPTPRSNGFQAAQPAPPAGGQRTTSAYTTHADQPTTNGSSGTRPPSSSSGWDTFNGTQGGAGGFDGGEQPGLGGGFGQPPEEQGSVNPEPSRRSIGESRPLPSGVEETVTISMLPEKEGVFLFQHRNYEVKSARRGSSVVRRYSDFVWLLDCLHKRYPFRQLPLLPPKRVAGTCFS